MRQRRFEPTACGRVTGRVVKQRWTENEEPHLDEVLADPIVHLVMKRDGVSIPDLRAVVARAKYALGDRLCRRIAA